LSVEFEWDEKKAAANSSKQGVLSVNEQRHIMIGKSSADRILLVSYTERDQVVRLISAREAALPERRDYEEGQEKGG
jgi:uncharacterized protein